MYKYTKINDELVGKYGLKVAYIYAKLQFRMRLSCKSKRYFDNGYFVIYKIKALMHDCHLGRNSVANALNVLEHVHLIKRVHTMFASKIYLPQFGNQGSTASKQTNDSHECKRSEQLKFNNKDSNNYVYVTSSSVKKAKKYPKSTDVIKKYGKRLYKYAVETLHKENDCRLQKVHSPQHFIIGILRRWSRKGIKTLNDAMKSEHDGRAKYDDNNGPKIPIFKI